MTNLEDALDEVREAFAEQRREHKELLENFDRLREAHRTLAREATITVEEEEWLFELLSELVDLSLLVDLDLDRTLYNRVISKLKERRHARQQVHQHRDR